jgi:hypothetical protein
MMAEPPKMRELSPNRQAQFALQKQHKKRLARLRERNLNGANRAEEEEQSDDGQ